MSPPMWASIVFLGFLSLAFAQDCENYGVVNGSSCTCPTGFGGPTCSEIACGGSLFEGSQRPLTSTPSGFANLTAGDCSCPSGWGGFGCNVCQSDDACQNASSDLSAPDSSVPGMNHTIVCNKSSRVFASSQMSCSVDNPTLRSFFPGSTYINIIRTINPTQSPLPNTSSFGSAGTAYASVFHNGVEQFYCYSDACAQKTLPDGSSKSQCDTLKCTCRSGTTFCGASRGISNLTTPVNALTGPAQINCDVADKSTGQVTCHFIQSSLQILFGNQGLALNSCDIGECVRQNVIDSNNDTVSSKASLSGGVIAGLVVVVTLVSLALLFLAFGLWRQRKARLQGYTRLGSGGVAVEWKDLSYVVPSSDSWGRKKSKNVNDDKVILDNVNGLVLPGQIMAILGPSGAGKTSLIEILSGRYKAGSITGSVSFPSQSSLTTRRPRIGFVPQQDILPPMLTVQEALLFAANLRLPEGVPEVEKQKRVDNILEKLGLEHLRNTRIGDNTGSKARGISGGEMRRVSIGLELIASPDVLILDEPTSGLDSVSAARVANVLRSIAHDTQTPTAVIASIHQPSSQLYQTFDTVLVLAHGRTLYCGPGAFAPVEHFAQAGPGVAPTYPQGYNVADYLLEVASDPPLALLALQQSMRGSCSEFGTLAHEKAGTSLDVPVGDFSEKNIRLGNLATQNPTSKRNWLSTVFGPTSMVYATTFLTQLECLCGREWKILRRDKTLFITHISVASVLGAFCGGLYFHLDLTIAGFQSRVGCLYFLGSLTAFSSLSALYNVMEIRPLFLRERSSSYYSPIAWLFSRFIFDVIPLRLIPTIIVSTITYWMAGLDGEASHFLKFLLILVLYTLVMTLFNFLLGTLFRNGGIALLVSALSALYQMTFAGFLVHLTSIPPVLTWLQWFCPLRFCLEAMAVNEVGGGLMIQDRVAGAPFDVSATFVLQLLFGYGPNNYYRDVLVLFAYIAAFGIAVILAVWYKVREQR